MDWIWEGLMGSWGRKAGLKQLRRKNKRQPKEKMRRGILGIDKNSPLLKNWRLGRGVRKPGRCYWKRDGALEESVSTSRWEGVVCERPPESVTLSVKRESEPGVRPGWKVESRENTQEKELDMSLVWKKREITVDECGRVKKGWVKLMVKSRMEERWNSRRVRYLKEDKKVGKWWLEGDKWRMCDGGEGHSRDSGGDSIFSNITFSWSRKYGYIGQLGWLPIQRKWAH